MEQNQTDWVIEQLRQCRGRWPDIVKRSGVPYSTLAKIAQRQIKNPGSRNIDALAAIFSADKARELAVANA